MEFREFSRYFDGKLYNPDLKSTSKDKVLAELVESISNQAKLKDSQLILDMIIRREQLGSTGIGKGIAIPHGRSISSPNLITMFGRSIKGINFNAIDKKPVHLFFMIIAPPQEQSNVYLPFLGKLVEILKAKKIRDKIKAVETYREFLETLSGGF